MESERIRSQRGWLAVADGGCVVIGSRQLPDRSGKVTGWQTASRPGAVEDVAFFGAL